VWQRWFHEIAPQAIGPEPDTVVCDAGPNCRRYAYSPPHVEGAALWAEAYRAFKDGEPRAELKFQAAMKMFPRFSQGYLWLAEFYKARGEIENAYTVRGCLQQ
jgi:hypothetical protein